MDVNLDWEALIPALDPSLHKGSLGRVCVVGGSLAYTGAPYFAGISALTIGADLCHVICQPDAAQVIKSYSPELIVHPLLAESMDATISIHAVLAHCHVVIIGPGLGKDVDYVDRLVTSMVHWIREHDIPLIIDADAIALISRDPLLVSNYNNCIITPNIMEFKGLCLAMNLSDTCSDSERIKLLAQRMNGPTIVCKGQVDLISDGNHLISCNYPGSPRRCGGQGDILSGTMAIYYHWAKLMQRDDKKTAHRPTSFMAALHACTLVRACSHLAFGKLGRSMLASDMLAHMHETTLKFYN